MAVSDPRRVTIPVTMACPVCASAFTPSGRRSFCSDACRAAAHRRRRSAARSIVVVPARVSRVPMTVYECDDRGTRAVGEQRCPDCSTFMRRLGIGGARPCCDEAITVAELMGLEVGP
jgi:predicted nucleic acid-binding Zn ribbon protein